jgi:hypothetical protein
MVLLYAGEYFPGTQLILDRALREKKKILIDRAIRPLQVY